jgi:maltooligosyltrehalose trehalohydrolase
MTHGRNATPADAAALGATPLGAGACRFRVWAPRAETLSVRLLDGPTVPLQPGPRGYHEGIVEDAPPGSRYLLRLPDGRERPDPASRAQPEGVHGPSEIVEPAFAWTDAAWENPPLPDYVIYELHVGAFTEHGTFDAVVGRLSALAELGVTAVELMPVDAFAGARNWGYDGVGLFAAHHDYGGPAGLKRLVDACHAHGLAVVLDVVYNHLGPEGNYLADFGPYFTDRYRTPWGPALNFDGPHADEVRRFFVANALYWTVECRVDALRLDAVHAIVDGSALPFVEELTAAVHEAAASDGRRVHVIAESAANDARLVWTPEAGGFGMDGAWNDDFHHALHALVTGERQGYYRDFGAPDQLGAALAGGWVYTGQYSPYYRRRHGRPCAGIEPWRFVVFSQNHDQVGNRCRGERLEHLAGPEAARLAAALVILAPGVPLLFMGEEYAEPAPFLYFTSHGDEGLAEAVRTGRKREFAAFGWRGDPPDPQAPETFERCRLQWSLRRTGRHGRMLAYYQALLTLRRTAAPLGDPEASVSVSIPPDGRAIVLRRWTETAAVAVLFNPAPTASTVVPRLEGGIWRRLIDSADTAWGGPGGRSPETIDGAAAGGIDLAPWAAAVYAREHRT